MNRTAAFFALNRSVTGLLVMVVLVALGEKMAERFLPIYLLALGGGVLSIGLLNGLDNLLSALYSFPGGYLAGRLGARRSLLVFNGMAMAGYLVVILIPHPFAVIGGAFLFLSWTALSLPATMQILADAVPRTRRTMGVSVISITKRIPMSLGPLLGGALIGIYGETRGVRLAFVVAFLLAAVATVLQQRLIAEERPGTPLPGRAPAGPGSPFRLLRAMDPALRRLLVADILVRFCEQIPYAFVVVWAMKTIERPVTAAHFGVLTTIEMAVAVLCYIPVARLADRGAKKPFVVATFGFFTLFPLVVWGARSFWPLAGAFVIRGLKEFGEPTRKALILDLSPEGRQAATFGAYYLCRDVIVSVAAFGGALLWQVSPAANFLTAFVCGLIGTLWFAWRGRDLRADPVDSAAAAS